MNKQQSEILGLKLLFLKYMKNSQYEEAHQIVQKIKDIDPTNQLISKCDKFLSEYKVQLRQKEIEINNEESSSEEEDEQSDEKQQEDDNEDNQDLEDIIEEAEMAEPEYDVPQFEKQKKKFYELLPTIDRNDPQQLKLLIQKIQKENQ